MAMMHFEFATKLARELGGTPLPDSKPLEDGVRYDLRLEFADEANALRFIARVRFRVENAVLHGPKDRVLVQVICSRLAMPEPAPKDLDVIHEER